MRVGRVHCALKLYNLDYYGDIRRRQIRLWLKKVVAVVVVSEWKCRPARGKEGSGSNIERGGKR